MGNDGFETLDQVPDARVNWLWPLRIPRGAITLVFGEAQAGKTTLLCDVAARLTRGKLMPDVKARSAPRPGHALILEAEDTPQVLRNRLAAAGADLARIIVPKSDSADAGLLRIPGDLARLEAIAREHRTRLIVISPLAAYADANLASDVSVRRALQPLAAMAQRLDAAVVIVNHLTKSTQRTALHYGSGSVAIAGLARSVLLVAQHPLDPERRVLAQAKNSFARLASSLSFQLVSGAAGPSIEWGKPIPISADELIATASSGGTELREAARFLCATLASGRLPSRQVGRLARDAAIAERTLRRAREALGVRWKRERWGRGGVVFWSLPPASDLVAALKDLEIGEFIDDLIDGGDPVAPSQPPTPRTESPSEPQDTDDADWWKTGQPPPL